MTHVIGMAASLLDVDLNRQQRVDTVQWRAEDVRYRNETIAWRQSDIAWRQADLAQRDLENRRREIDEKNEQLRQIANVAALIAGFSLTALVQISYPDNVPEWLLAALAVTSSVTVCFMVYSSLVCTLMIVATLKKFEGKDGAGFRSSLVPVTRANSLEEAESTVRSNNMSDVSLFELFWENQCASDWSRAVRAFSYGLSMFLLNLVVVGWVRFWPVLSPAVCTSVIASVTLLFIVFTVNLKWLNFLFVKRKTVPAAPGQQQ